MIFLQAFLLCGVAAAIAQIIVMKTNLGPLGTFNVFMVGGTVLGMVGIYGQLVEFGMMGAIVLIAGLCENFFVAFMAVFQGDFSGLITFVILLACILACCSLLGIVGKISPQSPDEEK